MGKGLVPILSVILTLMTVVAVSLSVLLWLKTTETQPETESRQTNYMIGVGRADCTGPAAEVAMMGYASPSQVAKGIHTRLYSRAFITADFSGNRVVFVSVDVGMISQKVRLEVLMRLKDKYGSQYNESNVVLSGTHTHSGPGGYFQYSLFVIASQGFIKPCFEAITSGIVHSIDIAHGNMKPGNLFLSRGEVKESNANRSPFSYLNNPAAERSRYKTNTDEDILLLKLVDQEGAPIGVVTWFAVHAVSMNLTNKLISSDNMGYAAYLFEQEMNPGFLPGEGPFVALFSSSNLGDSSPNTKGPHCSQTGVSCANVNSYCDVGGSKTCISMGPGDDIFESTKRIGENIYSKAKELFSEEGRTLTGPVNSAQQWVNMTDVVVRFNSTHTAKTCKPALGYSFAAGTTDGPGSLNIMQGTTEGNAFWDAIRDFLSGPPSNETTECQAPKPILLDTGDMTRPLPWHPEIVDVQMVTFGDFAVLAVPGEFTTMSGRRLREAVKKELQRNEFFQSADVVISGLSNVYTHYVTTFEEYQIQRYEGASTIYGPHTLAAYLQLYGGLARAIANGSAHDLPQGPSPPLFNESQLSSNLADTPADRAPDGMSFGDVLTATQPAYSKGDAYSITFVSGNPRNSVEFMRGGTFLTVEMRDPQAGTWRVIHTDASWETRFIWDKGVFGRSNATVSWAIPATAEAGKYRVRHFGHCKKRKNGTDFSVQPYSGTSPLFDVV
ncbi:neutral ceramidase [Lampetra fluviatilis]